MATSKLIAHAFVAICLLATASLVVGQTRNAIPDAQIKSWIPAKKMCTTAAKENWLTKEEFLLLMNHRGYKVQTFKIIYESCYEMYGFDKSGRIVEAYFNPENAQLSRQNYVIVK
jgi:hypothetical protein